MIGHAHRPTKSPLADNASEYAGVDSRNKRQGFDMRRLAMLIVLLAGCAKGCDVGVDVNVRLHEPEGGWPYEAPAEPVDGGMDAGGNSGAE